MMGDIQIIVDDMDIAGHENMTILKVAKENGIDIPTLCHRPDLKPDGVCRVCVVEVEGSKTLVGACHTPIAQGMVIYTQSQKVLSARKAIVELLLTAHTGTCVNDLNAANCELHRLASDLEVGQPRFRVRKPRYYLPEEANPFVVRDLSKCILCRRCIKACDEIAGKGILSIGYRGFLSKIITAWDEPLDHEDCKDCTTCADTCPTGALTSLKETQKGVV